MLFALNITMHQLETNSKCFGGLGYQCCEYRSITTTARGYFLLIARADHVKDYVKEVYALIIETLEKLFT